MIASPDSAPLDTMFDMLSNAHRRQILMAVADHNPRDVDEFEEDTSADAAADQESVHHAATMLRHSHLPKLSEYGYIEWDEETETIRRGPNFDDIAPLLKLMDDHSGELPEDWP